MKLHAIDQSLVAVSPVTKWRLAFWRRRQDDKPEPPVITWEQSEIARLKGLILALEFHVKEAHTVGDQIRHNYQQQIATLVQERETLQATNASLAGELGQLKTARKRKVKK